MGRTKIVLDADVVIDFKDAKHLADLPRILPDYDFVILDIVLDQELGKWRSTKEYILRLIEWDCLPDFHRPCMVCLAKWCYDGR